METVELESKVVAIAKDVFDIKTSFQGHGAIINHGKRLEVDVSMRLSDIKSSIETLEESTESLVNSSFWTRDSAKEILYNTNLDDNVSIGTKDAVSKLTVNGDINVLDNDLLRINSEGFKISPNKPTVEGSVYWDSIGKTLEAKTDTATVIPMGEKTVIRVVNATDGPIPNGTVVYVYNVATDLPTIRRASSAVWEKTKCTIGICDTEIGAGSQGFVTMFGRKENIDTSAYSAGDFLYLDTTDGNVVTTPPPSPAFFVRIGFVLEAGVDGVIFVALKYSENSSFFNGTFVESFNCLVTSDGATVTATLNRSGGGDLTMRYDKAWETLSCPASVVLTPGTVINPVPNYVYIPIATKVLTKSTTGWPTGQHIKVTYVLISTASYVQSDGAMINQNWNDHNAGTDGQGHLSHIGQRVRRSGAIYVEGIDPNGLYSYFNIAVSDVRFLSTAGTISQMHDHTVPLKNTNTDDYHIVNHFTTPNISHNNLYDITDDSTGTAIGNNKYFNLVFWMVGNKGGEYAPLMVNLPSGTYNSADEAEKDLDRHDSYTIPKEYRIESSTGFLVCRATFKKVGTLWVHQSTLDLRGITPTQASGGVGGFDGYWSRDTLNNLTHLKNVGDNVAIGLSSTVEKFEVRGNIVVLAADGERDNDWVAEFSNNEMTVDHNYGMFISAGSSYTDIALRMTAYSGGVDQFEIKGDGVVGFGTTTPLRNIGTSSGDLGSTQKGLHYKTTETNGQSVFVLEGEGASPNGEASGFGGGRILFSGDLGGADLKNNQIIGGGRVIAFQSLNDNLTKKHELIRFDFFEEEVKIDGDLLIDGSISLASGVGVNNIVGATNYTDTDTCIWTGANIIDYVGSQAFSGHWNRASGVLSPSTIADSVAIGASSLVSTEKFLIQGSSTGGIQQIIKNTNTGINNTTVLDLIASNETSGFSLGKISATHVSYPNSCFLWNYKIGSMRFGTSSAEVGRFSKDGYFGIGETNPQYRVHIDETRATSPTVVIKNHSSTGSGLYVQGGATTQYAIRVNNYSGTKRFEVLGNGNANLPTGNLCIGYSNGGNRLGIQTGSSELGYLEIRKSTGMTVLIGDAHSSNRQGYVGLFDGATENVRLKAGANSYLLNSLSIGSSSLLGSENLLVQGSSTYGTYQVIKNTNTSVTNSASLYLIASNETSGFSLGKYSATYPQYQNGCFLWNYRNGPMRFGTNTIERMIIGADGMVGFNVASPSRLIDASISASGYQVARFINTHATGFGVSVDGGATTQYAIRVNNYAGTKRFEVLGNGKCYMPHLTNVSDPAYPAYRQVYVNVSTGELVYETRT